ncbi:hypothetical protein PR048_014642 [Dryococelus australis]|uniref:Uncharacterized protein n=1 Tax=Dryococelus australis TaxID=614101 RepID=A0ABQ9HEU3_9NEOP|nr:hypothetical protein PR048_014642 [Dryococelus australis]
MESSPTNIDLYCPATYVDNEVNGAIIPGEWHQHIEVTPLLQDLGRFGANNTARAAITIRNVVCDYLNSQEGEVVWLYQSGLAMNVVNSLNRT